VHCKSYRTGQSASSRRYVPRLGAMCASSIARCIFQEWTGDDPDRLHEPHTCLPALLCDKPKLVRRRMISTRDERGAACCCHAGEGVVVGRIRVYGVGEYLISHISRAGQVAKGYVLGVSSAQGVRSAGGKRVRHVQSPGSQAGGPGAGGGQGIAVVRGALAPGWKRLVRRVRTIEGTEAGHDWWGSIGRTGSTLRCRGEAQFNNANDVCGHFGSADPVVAVAYCDRSGGGGPSSRHLGAQQDNHRNAVRGWGVFGEAISLGDRDGGEQVNFRERYRPKT